MQSLSSSLQVPAHQGSRRESCLFVQGASAPQDPATSTFVRIRRRLCLSLYTRRIVVFFGHTGEMWIGRYGNRILPSPRSSFDVLLGA